MKKKIFAFVLILAVAIMCCSCTSLISGIVNGTITPGVNSRVDINLDDIDSYSEASLVANNTVDACVRVETEYLSGNTSAGAGFIITTDGYIVTNRHVVQQYRGGGDLPRNLTDTKLSVRNIKIVFSNNIYYEAEIIYVSDDATIDVAILKMDVPGIEFKYLKLDKTTDLFYGQNAYTFGNPSNIGLTFSKAMIASPAVTFNSNAANGTSVTYEDVILLDSNVNHGNSGGALISNKGNVIGIVYGRIETSDNSVNDVYGLGLAIPTSKIINIIKKSGEASKIHYTLYTGEEEAEDETTTEGGEE